MKSGRDSAGSPNRLDGTLVRQVDYSEISTNPYVFNAALKEPFHGFRLPLSGMTQSLGIFGAVFGSCLRAALRADLI